MFFGEVSVRVPVTMRGLHEPNTGLAETPSHEALFSKVLGGPGISSVELLDVIGLLRKVLNTRDFHLHFEGQFVGSNP